MRDRHERDYCFGPTHEEVITDIARKELRSYKQLPINFYQIQTKFRDEIRPRFGVMRAREFIMKDAYSFHVDQASLEEGYRKMHTAYTAIFRRLGLRFRVVDADSGEIGGSRSQEFHVLADSGEDAIAWSEQDNYASNIETAATLPPVGKPAAPVEYRGEFNTVQVGMGQALRPTLDGLDVPHFTMEREDEVANIMNGAIKLAFSTDRPVAVIVSPLLSGGKSL